MAERTYRAQIALSLWAVLCTALVGLRSWLPQARLTELALCCGPLDQLGIGHELGAHLLTLLGTGLLAIGLGTLTRKAWHAARWVGQVLSSTHAEIPPHSQVLIAQLGLDGHVVLVQSELPLAFCFGFVRPRICVSTALLELLDPSQLQAVLWHEDFHRQHRDPLRLLLIDSFSAMLFFLPVVREWGEMLKVRLELAADRAASRQIGTAALAGALYRLVTGPSTLPTQTVPAVAGLSATPVRIAALLGQRQPPLRFSPKSLLGSALGIYLLCLLLMI